MRILYIPKKTSPITTIKYGLLYNWFAASSPATVEYGYLYNWYAATDARNLANTGWHVPTVTEWLTLQTYIGGFSFGEKLASTGTSYWDVSGGTNEYSFNGRGCGLRDWTTGVFSYLRGYGYHMCATASDSLNFYTVVLTNTTFSIGGTTGKGYGAGVRLMKDSTSLTHGQTGTYIGNDGRTYATICIGTQEWISENLMETKYRNGDDIPEVSDNTAWSALTTGARCAYNNTITNVGLGSRLISSNDWVIPDRTQALLLTTNAGGFFTGAFNVKESGTTYWITNNGVNSTGFNSRGNGNRNDLGVFTSQKERGRFWYSYTPSANILDVRDYTYEFTDYGNVNFKNGEGIRLLYTGAGTPTSYTGNDGKIYRVITIGTQTWLADNLAETKYRDGSTIPEVTVDATWAALTTGARCSYNNDPSNV